jgi:GR25 family glycosyltransferase involved in LPS biosynthesis
MVDSIYFKIINLAHRQDRRNECLQELKGISIGNLSDIFFEAKLVEHLGAVGCALSHAMVLSNFLFNTDKPYIVVLEDDFQIRDEVDLVETINDAISNSLSWDVFLLGHNSALPIEATHMVDTLRVINVQTMSGYLVGRSYAPKLIESFFKSAELLEKYKDLPSPNKELARSLFCCDMLWKKLQIDDTYWATFPSVITQRKSFSDIERRVVDYGV